MNNETKINDYCLPEKLRKLRGSNSLQKVSDDLGISRASLGYYESGERKPDAEILLKIANYYNVSCDYLLGRTEAQTTDSNIQMIHKTTGLSERAIETLVLYNKNATIAPEDEFDTNPMYFKLIIETLNILLFPLNEELINNIMLYIFSNFENYYDDYNFSDENSYNHISEIGYFDKKLGISFHEDHSFLSSIFLSKVQENLVKLREIYNSNHTIKRVTPIAGNGENNNVPFE